MHLALRGVTSAQTYAQSLADRWGRSTPSTSPSPTSSKTGIAKKLKNAYANHKAAKQQRQYNSSQRRQQVYQNAHHHAGTSTGTVVVIVLLVILLIAVAVGLTIFLTNKNKKNA